MDATAAPRAPARRLQARDRWIGWDDDTRRLHLHPVVNLSRFLIRPGVQGPHLARHGYRPWLAETFVDTRTHDGVSLKAGNRIRPGCTASRGHQDRGRVSAETPEQVFVYPLERDWMDLDGTRAAPAT